MISTIKSNQLETSRAPTPQRPGEAERGSSLSTNPDAKNTAGEQISISSGAKTAYIQSTAAERQASMTPSELSTLRSKAQSDIRQYSRFLAASSGSDDYSHFLPKTDDPARLETAQRALDFALGTHNKSSGSHPNPYSGMGRSQLTGIYYDDTGTFSSAEKYAAYDEFTRQDARRFEMLKASNGGDNREFFKSILDYLDELSPAEKAGYPEGHRESIQKLMDAEERKWGLLRR